MSDDKSSPKSKKSLDDIDDEYEEKLNKIREDLDDSFQINQRNLDTEVMKTISKLHYYNSILSEEKLQLKKIIRKKNEIYGKLYEKYRFNYDMKLDKGEISHWIERNPLWQKINNYYESHKELCDFIERTLKSFQNKSFAIKNLIDLKRIELGM